MTQLPRSQNVAYASETCDIAIKSRKCVGVTDGRDDRPMRRSHAVNEVQPT